MNAIDTALFGSHAILFLANVAAVVVVTATLGTAVAHLCRKRSAPVGYGILSCSLALLIAAPGIVVLGDFAGVGWIRIASEPFIDVAASSDGLSSQGDQPVPSQPLDEVSFASDAFPTVVEREKWGADDEHVEDAQAPFAGEWEAQQDAGPEPSRRSEAPPQPTTSGAIAGQRPLWLVLGGALAVVWAIGTIVRGLLLLRGLMRLFVFRRSVKTRAPLAVERAAARLSSQVGLRQPPRILLSTRIQSPVAVGFFSPAIILPVGFANDIEAEQLDDVLLHEMAHIARRDHLAGLAQCLAEVLYWWCPLVVVMNRGLRRLREEICDNYVLRAHGDGGRFAELLVVLAERAAGAPRLPAAAGLFDAGDHELELRVKRLLSADTNTLVRTNWKTRASLATFAAAIAALALALTVRADATLQAQPETPAEAEGEPIAKKGPPGLLAEIGSPRLQHGRQVNAVRFSHDGNRLFSASDDFTVRAWDVATGDELKTFATDTGSVKDLALSADEQMLLAATDDSGVLLWNVESGKQVGQLGDGYVHTLALAADDSVLFTAGESGVRSWNPANGKENPKVETADSTVSRLVISADGAWLAGASRASVILWNVATGKVQHALTRPDDHSLLTALAFSPDATLVAATNTQGTTLLWDVHTGKLKADVAFPSMGSGTHPTSIAFSPDSKTIYAGRMDGRIQAFDWKKVRQQYLVEAQLGPVACITVSADGKTLATGGANAQRTWDHSIHLWDAERGRELPQSQRVTGDMPSVLAVTPDGRRVVKGCFHRRLTVWDVPDNKLLRRIDLPDAYSRVPIALSPDGKRIAAGGGRNVRIFDCESGESLGVLEAETRPGSGMCFTPDGQTLVIGTVSDALVIWHMAAERLQRNIEAHAGEIWALDCSPDGLRFATGGFDGSVAVWSVADGKLLYKLKGHNSLVRAVKFSSDGMRLASVSADQQAIVWEVATGKIVRRFDTGWSSSSVAFCDRDRILITGHHFDRLHCWDIATGERIDTWRLRPGPFTSAVVVSPDERRLWTADSDSVVRLWELPTLLQKLPPLAKQELTAAELDGLWTSLADSDPAVANDAAWKLAGASDPAIELLRKQFTPYFAVERRELGEDEIQKLIKELDDDRFPIREAATGRLREAGPTILPALKKELAKTKSVEVRNRLTGIVAGIEAFDPLAALSQDDLRAMRAVQILAYLNTPATRGLLESLQKGSPQKPPCRSATAALARLQQLNGG